MSSGQADSILSGDEVIRLIARATSAATGPDLFRSLVRSLACALRCRWAVLSECVPGSPQTMRVLAFWADGGFAANTEYQVSGDIGMDPPFIAAQWRAGTALHDSSGRQIGVLLALHDAFLKRPPCTQDLMAIFAVRAAAELELQRIQGHLQQRQAELDLRIQERTFELRSANDAMRGEIEERMAAQEQLRQNEQRYAGILNAQETLIVRADSDNRITYMNTAYERAFGLKVGDTFFVRVHPDDLDITREAMEQLYRPPYTCSVEQRCNVRGEWRWIHWQDSVIRDRHGVIVEVQGVGFDITERKRAEAALQESQQHYKDTAEANRRLLLELDHRVRNNLSALLGLLSVMRNNAADVGSFAEAIEARLRAMAHLHQLLGDTRGTPMSLHTLITSLLRTMQSMARHQIPTTVEGPDLAIGETRALPLTMVLLEWFTNSCKYGAHSSPGGRLEITWHTAPHSERISLRWKESGGPPIVQPVSTSLGTELVRSFVLRELRGECLLQFEPDGVNHVIEFCC